MTNNNPAAALILALSFFALPSVASAETIDTLSRYRQSGQPIEIHDESCRKFAGRFRLAAPAQLLQLNIRLGGVNASGRVRLQIFGSEGDAAFPLYERDLIEPLTLRKTQRGAEWIEVPLHDGPLIRGTQFYVLVEHLDRDVYLISDNSKREPCCTSVEGEAYYDQLVKSAEGEWRYLTGGFAIEALVSYPAEDSKTHLRDVTRELGVDDSLAIASIAFGDYDRDGFYDLLAGGKLYRNAGGYFLEQDAGLNLEADCGMACFIDVNADLYPDLLTVGGAASEIQIHLNQQDGRFTNLPSMLELGALPQSFSISDFNNDGLPDIYIAGRLGDLTIQHSLLRNDGRNGFSDVGEVYLPASIGGGAAIAPAALWQDWNADGLPDLLLNRAQAEHPEILLNQGQDKRFVSYGNAEASPVPLHTGTSAGDIGDLNGDGKADFIAGLSTARKGPQQEGDPIPSAAVFGSDIKFDADHAFVFREVNGSVTLVDINNDALPDIFVASPDTCQSPRLLLQQPGGAFVDESYAYGMWDIKGSRDAVWIDLDNDGRLDLATNNGAFLALYRNEGPYDNNFLSLDLNGRPAPVAAGARVDLYQDGSRRSATVIAGRGALRQGAPRLHFGMGDERAVDSLIIHWPDGSSESIIEPRTNEQISLDEDAEGILGRDRAVLELDVYPMPVKDEALVRIRLHAGMELTLGVYDLQNRLVATLIDDSRLDRGVQQLRWRPLDERNGNRLAPGSYLMRLRADGQELVRRIIIAD